MISLLTMGTLKTLRFNCSIVNQFEMCHIFFKMYLFLCRHFDIKIDKKTFPKPSPSPQYFQYKHHQIKL